MYSKPEHRAEDADRGTPGLSVNFFSVLLDKFSETPAPRALRRPMLVGLAIMLLALLRRAPGPFTRAPIF